MTAPFSSSRSQLVNREDVIFLITHQRSALLEAAERDGMKPHHAEVLRDMASWWGDLAEAVKKLSDRSVTRSESAAPVTPSHVAALTPDWCMDAFWRANPGRNAVVPSLYLLDFAREVLRVHGVQSATAQRNGIIEECAKQCDASADEAEELLRRQPWSEYARACMNEAASLAIRIRALAAAESRSKDV
jgi:hypothetical protein